MTPRAPRDRLPRHYSRPVTNQTPVEVIRARGSWAELTRNGGIITSAGLRVRWGAPGRPLNRGRVAILTSEVTFPPPVFREGQTRVWLTAEVDEWMRERVQRDGKPGPKPSHTRGADR